MPRKKKEEIVEEKIGYDLKAHNSKKVTARSREIQRVDRKAHRIRSKT